MMITRSSQPVFTLFRPMRGPKNGASLRVLEVEIDNRTVGEAASQWGGARLASVAPDCVTCARIGGLIRIVVCHLAKVLALHLRAQRA